MNEVSTVVVEQSASSETEIIVEQPIASITTGQAAVALAVEAISDDSPPIVIVVEQPVTSVVESERQGVAGAQGEQGLSAYEVAVENGFEGTEEDWLASLVFLGVDPVYVNLSGFEFTIDRQNRNTIQVFNSAGYEVSVVVQLTETEFFISSLVDLSGHTAMLSY